MRELQISSGNLKRAFEDIELIAENCRFKDCSHKSEPGCAVKAAIETGELDAERFESYIKLQRETLYTRLNSKQLENEKINRMFGSKAEMKRAKNNAKQN
jgi:ribosome biogenesis GTPase